jgi:hypothetical protein
MTTGHVVSRERLHQRLEAFAQGRAFGGAPGAHAALLDRLAANGRVAESNGWTTCALERPGGMGRLAIWGLPPGGGERREIPDWLPQQS